jgi:hypothetical protein
MTTTPITVLLTAAVGLGIYLGLAYLRKERKVGWNAVHLLVGAGGVEQLLVRVQGSPSGSIGYQAVLVLGVTMVLGFLAAVIGGNAPRKAEYVLIAHATAGLAGFVLFLAWLSTV